ncbi:hypothetical protein BKA70DRAFT_1471246 [Coprinopsis sp. MPI-PUGE-AT-0042]|nr:hypothetical protein BKA70DRAFT_1471246 [Coprinopsis sp. MPI-PUGE-AT-0042]
MEKMETDVSDLQEAIYPNNAETYFIQNEHEASIQISNPVRNIPIEVLGVIVAFTVSPSSFNRFIDVAHLRGVCVSWRRAALSTPGLCSELTVVLDKWCTSDTRALNPKAFISRMVEGLKPWLAILPRTRHYHLTLTSLDPFRTWKLDGVDEKHHIESAHYLVSVSSTQPGIVTLGSPEAVIGAILLASLGFTCSVLKLEILVMHGNLPLHALNSVFPNLEALDISCYLRRSKHPAFFHPSLRTLHLSNLMDDIVLLRWLFQYLPSLCELSLNSMRSLYPFDDYDIPPTTYAHRSLEILIPNREDILFPLRYVSFPSLRLLAIHGDRFIEYDNETFRRNIFTSILSRSLTIPLLLSLHGMFEQRMLVPLLSSLPPNTHLHFDISRFSWRQNVGTIYEGDLHKTIPIESDNIETIICGLWPVDLVWLSTSIAQTARKHSSRPLTVYLPTGYECWDKVIHVKTSFKDKGLNKSRFRTNLQD